MSTFHQNALNLSANGLAGKLGLDRKQVLKWCNPDQPIDLFEPGLVGLLAKLSLSVKLHGQLVELPASAFPILGHFAADPGAISVKDLAGSVDRTLQTTGEPLSSLLKMRKRRASGPILLKERVSMGQGRPYYKLSLNPDWEKRVRKYPLSFEIKGTGIPQKAFEQIVTGQQSSVHSPELTKILVSNAALTVICERYVQTIQRQGLLASISNSSFPLLEFFSLMGEQKIGARYLGSNSIKDRSVKWKREGLTELVKFGLLTTDEDRSDEGIPGRKPKLYQASDRKNMLIKISLFRLFFRPQSEFYHSTLRKTVDLPEYP